MRKPKSISDGTKHAVLEAAWTLIAERGRADVGMAEIAATAGVSRQAMFYAFGGRAGLLLAMVRHKDRMSEEVGRLIALGSTAEPTRETILGFAEVWLEYLPTIYPVGILLDAAAITDKDASDAWKDRMIDGLLAGFRRMAKRVNAREALNEGPDRTADEIWAEIHPSMWRRLVVECGWSPESFQANRVAAVRRILGLG